MLPNSYPANHGVLISRWRRSLRGADLPAPIPRGPLIKGMLSSTRNIYKQTFAGPGSVLLRKRLALDFDLFEEEADEKMLLIQPRKGRGQRSSHRSGATSATNDHATSHPASWQANPQKAPLDAQTSISTGVSENASTTQQSPRAFSETAIKALSLRQLQDLRILVEERIQIKKRFNSTPLRRIINYQAPCSAAHTVHDVDEDAASQTDTLVNNEPQKPVREPLEVRKARYNNTPLRRILSRQASSGYSEHRTPQVPVPTQHEPEPLSVRRARYNNTPLRRILSHQASLSSSISHARRNALPATQAPVANNAPVPRSNTPLRRILSRQASAQPGPRKEDDDVSKRADSVIDPDSPVRSRITVPAARISLNEEEKIGAYETDLWALTSLSPTPSSPPRSSEPEQVLAPADLNDEARVCACEEAVREKAPIPCSLEGDGEKDKSSTATVTVTEVTGVHARRPRLIVVESKGSPLRRILQRQTSKDWRAAARVGAV